MGSTNITGNWRRRAAEAGGEARRQRKATTGRLTDKPRRGEKREEVESHRFDSKKAPVFIFSLLYTAESGF